MRNIILLLIAISLTGLGALAAEPWADVVIGYEPGDGAAASYADPNSALGHPSTLTDDGSIWPPDPTAPPVAVRMTDSAWASDQLVSVGTDGYLIIGFDEPVENDPFNPFGIDLIVFGNASFGTTDWPVNKQISDPAGLWDEPGQIEVSEDGVTFYTIRRDLIETGRGNVFADSLFPTHAFDSDDAHPADGTLMQDFTMPVDPALSLSDFDGLTVAQALDLYNGSAGGAPVDLDWAVDELGEPVLLESVLYVRILGSSLGSEVDAMADVPPVSTAVALHCGWVYESQDSTPYVCQLDGTGSFQATTFQWEQLGGAPVVLRNAATAKPDFDAPQWDGSTELSEAEALLRFRLTINAGEADESSDVCEITVRIPGDSNGDGAVNGFDVALLRLSDPAADFDGNGIVNANDVATLRKNAARRRSTE